MKWKIRQAAYEDIKALQDRFALNLISARILAGRGVCSPEKARFWLESDIFQKLWILSTFADIIAQKSEICV